MSKEVLGGKKVDGDCLSAYLKAIFPGFMGDSGETTTLQNQHGGLRFISYLVAYYVIFEGDYPGFEVFTEPFASLLAMMPIPGLPSVLDLVALVFGALAMPKSLALLRGRSNAAEVHATLFYGAVMVLGLAAIWVPLGLLQGGDFRVASWQTIPWPQFFCWSMAAFHYARDLRSATSFCRVFAFAIIVKTFINLAVYFAVYGGSLTQSNGDVYEYLSSHFGSIYMAIGMAIFGAGAIAAQDSRTRLIKASLFLLVAIPWVLNERRISMLGFIASVVVYSPLFFYLFKPIIMREKWKIAASLLVGLPLFWFSPANPIPQFLAADPSGAPDYREIENYNLYMHMTSAPLLGSGYGFPFPIFYPLPDVVRFGEVLAWIPHNSILMTWSFTGSLGMAMFAMVFVTSVVISGRLFRAAPTDEGRIFAIVTLFAVGQYLFYCWADIGYGAAFVPAVFVGLAGKSLYVIVKGAPGRHA